ncbi:MAG TPA: sugar ABC transporter permease [Bacillota bacterium]|nr:sugar ABC transporter permease [Bacillota bacterium]
MSNNVGTITVESAEKKKPKRKKDRSPLYFKMLFLLPAVAFLAFFMVYPIWECFRLSFMRASALGDEVYIGFANYAKFFENFIQNLFSGQYKNVDYQAGFVHVFLWAFWSVVIQIPLMFFVAYSLSTFKNRVTGPLRAIYYLAYIMPSAITAMLGRFIFQPTYGVISSLATTLHWGWLEKIDFLGDPKLAFWSVFTVATWAYAGFGIVYLMANIEQIPVELREAASLDGANRWQYARYVVLPLLNYPLRIMAIISTVGSLKLFELPWLITSGGPGYHTYTMGITLYRVGLRDWQYGMGAAVGVIMFVSCLVFTVVQFSLQRKDGEM